MNWCQTIKFVKIVYSLVFDSVVNSYDARAVLFFDDATATRSTKVRRRAFFFPDIYLFKKQLLEVQLPDSLLLRRLFLRICLVATQLALGEEEELRGGRRRDYFYCYYSLSSQVVVEDRYIVQGEQTA